MKNLFAILFAACLLSACGNSQAPNNAFNPATGWAQWQKNAAPVFSATTHIASDPSVIADESVFRLAYTGVDLSNPMSAACQHWPGDVGGFDELGGDFERDGEHGERDRRSAARASWGLG